MSRMADAMVMFDGLLHEAGDQVRVRPAADFECLLTAPGPWVSFFLISVR